MQETATESERLRRRRAEIGATLRYIEFQQREVEENTEWLDDAAHESRIALLDRLTGWYLDELDEIDRALGGVRENRYGACLVCREPIEAERLESDPAAEFCFGCEEERERLKAG
ncbi:MAG TPA: TraR/DksA C4-type zinc finger protein [Candidatus Binatia bacterium]|nr:TraR/DksA C4-type zinc finger protein [Candidatus Binatia bacterium]